MDRFRICVKSHLPDKPGAKKGEFVKNIDNYALLPKYFRRMISTYETFPFMYRDHKFRTPEHALAYLKCQHLGNPEASMKFTLDGDDIIAKLDAVTARREPNYFLNLNEKAAKLWDRDNRAVCLKDIFRNKFKQSPIHMASLMETQMAQLWETTMGKNEITRLNYLEELRYEFRLAQPAAVGAEVGALVGAELV